MCVLVRILLRAFEFTFIYHVLYIIIRLHINLYDAFSFYILIYETTLSITLFSLFYDPYRHMPILISFLFSKDAFIAFIQAGLLPPKSSMLVQITEH